MTKGVESMRHFGEAIVEVLQRMVKILVAILDLFFDSNKTFLGRIGNAGFFLIIPVGVILAGTFFLGKGFNINLENKDVLISVGSVIMAIFASTTLLINENLVLYIRRSSKRDA